VRHDSGNISPERIFLQQILQSYRFRWQIELIFERFKQIAQLGHLPKYDES
jgi:IS4 transposase